MKEQKEKITGNRRGLKLIFCCLLLTLVCGGLVCAQYKAKHVKSLPYNHELYEFMLPEYDLTKRELYSKLIDATYKLNRTDSSDRSNYRPAMIFYTSDSVEYCEVTLLSNSSVYGVFTSAQTLTGFGVLNGDTVLIGISNDTKIPLKSKKKSKIRTHNHPAFYDPFFAGYRMEGRNARLVYIMYEDVETK